jgi:hypothetical protein
VILIAASLDVLNSRAKARVLVVRDSVRTVADQTRVLGDERICGSICSFNEEAAK